MSRINFLLQKLMGIWMNKRLIVEAMAVVFSGYLIWQNLTPVEIVAVHDGNTILVRHFPYLKSHQIMWWEDNKDQIQAKYGIPRKGKDGFYHVWVIDFGNGYRTEPDESLLFSTDKVYCFNDMSTEVRCIDRKPLFDVRWSRNYGLRYESY